MTLSIGSHPDYRGGKYVLFIDGQPTRHWAAMIKQIGTWEPDEGKRIIFYPEITDEMIALVNAFDWPAQRKPELEEDSEVELRCSCGEVIGVVYLTESDPVECETCGRQWRIAVTITEVTP